MLDVRRDRQAMNDPGTCPTCGNYYPHCPCDTPSPVTRLDQIIAGLFICGAITAAAAFLILALPD